MDMKNLDLQKNNTCIFVSWNVDWTKDLSKIKCIGDYIFTLHGTPISWVSHKQNVIALSIVKVYTPTTTFLL
jgi:hypothetical protein